MTHNEKILLVKLLRMAADEFSNHGCNDFDLSELIPDRDERDELVRKYHEWNGDLEDFIELEDLRLSKPDGPDYRLMDWALFDYFADQVAP